MSFILEALRKSESDRQRLGTVALADLPVARRHRGQPWWVFALSGLLLVNLLVLVLVLIRDQPEQATDATNTLGAVQTLPLSQRAPQQLAPVVPAVSNPLQEAAEPTAQVDYEMVPASELELANAAASVPDGPTLVRSSDALRSETNKGLATADSAVADAQASRDLRIDLHVYSKNSRERFVLINMRRYTEGQQLPNGATVEQITPEGALLYQNGTRYQLDRR